MFLCRSSCHVNGVLPPQRDGRRSGSPDGQRAPTGGGWANRRRQGQRTGTEGCQGSRSGLGPPSSRSSGKRTAPAHSMPSVFLTRILKSSRRVTVIAARRRSARLGCWLARGDVLTRRTPGNNDHGAGQGLAVTERAFRAPARSPGGDRADVRPGRRRRHGGSAGYRTPFLDGDAVWAGRTSGHWPRGAQKKKPGAGRDLFAGTSDSSFKRRALLVLSQLGIAGRWPGDQAAVGWQDR